MDGCEIRLPFSDGERAIIVREAHEIAPREGIAWHAPHRVGERASRECRARRAARHDMIGAYVRPARSAARLRFSQGE